ncbi:hypothetical protein [Nocardioides bruguierae]|uniref:hypothetical protein n=1 Tax=Nocardioides bruguierae TaxID=2945102 RepID=UPI0020229B40|nr:hypothetical protein [Nocardioides bruguierae]MCL8026251.1 hypothetical protein [Nocardioides bruguierae]
MKKCVVSFLLLLLTSAGLVVLSGAPATAECPYTSCGTPVVRSASLQAKARNRAIIVARPVMGRSAEYPGVLVVTLVNSRGKVKTKSVRYRGDGTRRTIYVDGLRRGRWSYTVIFLPEDSTLRWATASGTTKWVKGRKRARS